MKDEPRILFGGVFSLDVCSSRTIVGNVDILCRVGCFRHMNETGTYFQIDFEDASNKRRLANTRLKKREYKSLRCRDTNVSDQHNPKSVGSERDTKERKEITHCEQAERDSSTLEGKFGVVSLISGAASIPPIKEAGG